MRALVLLCLLEAAFADHHIPLYSWDGPDKAEPTLGPNAGNACGMDQASCGCCVIQQQIDRLKTYINRSLNMLEMEYLQTNQSLTILETGRTAFSLGLYNDNRQRCEGPNNHNSVIVYKEVFLNLGGNYNVETGIFTVSRSGVYMLAVTIASDAGAPNAKVAICASLQVNGKAIASTQDVNRYDQEDSVTIVVVLYLEAAAQVTVSLPRGCFICDDDNHYNTFSGFLLYSTE